MNLRSFVAQRAYERCEYCLKPEKFSTIAFHVDHIISQRYGGETISHNLAYACHHCNWYKGSELASLDDRGQAARLFNPRTQSWADHFAIKGSLIIPLTSIDEATARCLKLNHASRVEERAALQAAGTYPKQS